MWCNEDISAITLNFFVKITHAVFLLATAQLLADGLFNRQSRLQRMFRDLRGHQRQ